MLRLQPAVPGPRREKLELLQPIVRSCAGGSCDQRSTSTIDLVFLNRNLVFRHRSQKLYRSRGRLRGQKGVCHEKSQRLRKGNRSVRCCRCVASLIESPPGQFRRRPSIILCPRIVALRSVGWLAGSVNCASSGMKNEVGVHVTMLAPVWCIACGSVVRDPAKRNLQLLGWPKTHAASHIENPISTRS